MPHQHATATVEVDLKTVQHGLKQRGPSMGIERSSADRYTTTWMRKVDVGEKTSCIPLEMRIQLPTGLHVLPACSSDIRHLHLSLYRAGVHSRLNPWLRSDLYFKGYTWHIAAQTRDISQVNLRLLLIIPSEKCIYKYPLDLGYVQKI